METGAIKGSLPPPTSSHFLFNCLKTIFLSFFSFFFFNFLVYKEKSGLASPDTQTKNFALPIEWWRAGKLVFHDGIKFRALDEHVTTELSSDLQFCILFFFSLCIFKSFLY